MINQYDAEIGETVWLRASTKAAPRECHLGLAAVLVDVSTDWPMVTVNVPDATRPEGVRPVKVHRQNVGLRPKVVKREKGGDQVGGGTEDNAPERKVRVLGKPVVDLDGQDVLF
jgi:hypothetical protein